MSLLPALESIVCKIYKTSSENVSDARYRLCCTSGATEQTLPPSHDGLIQHLRRVCYQAKVWRSATTAKMCAPSPVGCGWVLEDGELRVQWLSGPPAPPEILKITKCNCRKSGCQGAKLQCTALCGCEECSNGCQPDNDNESIIDGDSEPE